MKFVSASYVNYLLHLPPQALVRIYSYQGHEAWHEALRLGYWTGNDGRYSDGESSPEFSPMFAPAYKWMQEQMQLRIPDFTGDYPIWGWVRRPSTKPTSYPLQKGSEFVGVRLTALIPRCRIILSDYEIWHSILNRSGIYDTEVEFDAAESASKEEIEETWTKCFNFNQHRTPEQLDWMGSSKHFQVQACVDRIYWNEIIQVRTFISNNKRRVCE